MNTLDDLKRAEAAFRDCKERSIKYANELYETETHFLRTAFEWREGWHEHGCMLLSIRERDAWKIEGEEGMRLIREHLT